MSAMPTERAMIVVLLVFLAAIGVGALLVAQQIAALIP